MAIKYITLKCNNCGISYEKKASEYKSQKKSGQTNFFCKPRCRYDGITEHKIKPCDDPKIAERRKKLKETYHRRKNLEKGLDEHGDTLIIKGLNIDHLPYKLYRVKNPVQLVLKKPIKNGKRGVHQNEFNNTDFFIGDAPPFAAFLFLDQAIYFGDMLYMNSYLIVDESPEPVYRSYDIHDDLFFEEYNGINKLAKAMEDLDK